LERKRYDKIWMCWYRPEFKEYIFARDNHKCVICGSGEDLTVEHKIPVYRGGSDNSEFALMGNFWAYNLQTLCKRCNSGKAT